MEPDKAYELVKKTIDQFKLGAFKSSLDPSKYSALETMGLKADDSILPYENSILDITKFFLSAWESLKEHDAFKDKKNDVSNTILSFMLLFIPSSNSTLSTSFKIGLVYAHYKRLWKNIRNVEEVMKLRDYEEMSGRIQRDCLLATGTPITESNADVYGKTQDANADVNVKTQDVNGKTPDGKTQDVNGKTQDVNVKTPDANGKTQDVNGKTQDANGKTQDANADANGKTQDVNGKTPDVNVNELVQQHPIPTSGGSRKRKIRLSNKKKH